MSGSLRFVSVVIASGQSLSAVVHLSDAKLVGIQMPASWDAADLTVQACETSGGTYQNVYDDADNELVIQAAAGRHITLVSPDKFLGVGPYIKLRSGTSGTPVNQTADRTVKLLIRQYP